MSVALITLSGGESAFAVVDEADRERVIAAGNWHVRRHGRTHYAQRHVPLPGGQRTTEQLHRFLTGWSLVDHINGDGLDNRRCNLRPATHTENCRNSRPRGGTSAFKGVSWKTESGAWAAQIRINGKSRFLGYFDDEVHAARAYDFAAREVFGEFAWVNFDEVFPAPPPPRPLPPSKTHCKRGHSLDDAIRQPRGRACRTCANAANREYQRRLRASK